MVFSPVVVQVDRFSKKIVHKLNFTKYFPDLHIVTVLHRYGAGEVGRGFNRKILRSWVF